MRWKGKFALGLAAALSSAAAAQAQVLPSDSSTLPAPAMKQAAPSAKFVAVSGISEVAVGGADKKAPADKAAPATFGTPVMVMEDSAPPPPSYGPTPLTKVNIANSLIYGEEKPFISVQGWLDFDYTYRSTGSGQNNIAPVMNRFGDEFLVRQLGIYLNKATTQELSWGFNAIFIGGADASFLGPTAGGWANPNPRFGSQFTDLNLTAHLPFLTEGGIDVKAGRQTTCLGPMGALPWQRVFDSSDYAWYNLEEGRYTGVSTVWHVNKQLDVYNGIEIGGWGVFYPTRPTT